MFYVRVPKDISVVVDREPWRSAAGKINDEVSFARYLDNVVLGDPSIGLGYDKIRTSQDIRNKFEDAAPGTWVELSPEQWQMLESTINKPHGTGVLPVILCQFLPFMEAVLDAKREKPSDSDLVSEATK